MAGFVFLLSTNYYYYYYYYYYYQVILSKVFELKCTIDTIDKMGEPLLIF